MRSAFCASLLTMSAFRIWHISMINILSFFVSSDMNPVHLLLPAGRQASHSCTSAILFFCGLSAFAWLLNSQGP
jgi:hypothetical protein